MMMSVMLMIMIIIIYNYDGGDVGDDDDADDDDDDDDDNCHSDYGNGTAAADDDCYYVENDEHDEHDTNWVWRPLWAAQVELPPSPHAEEEQQTMDALAGWYSHFSGARIIDNSTNQRWCEYISWY